MSRGALDRSGLSFSPIFLYLASVVMYDEARIPAVEMLVHPHGGLQLLQQSAVCALALGVHGGTNIVQHAHDTGGVLQGDKGKLTSVLTGGLASRQSQTYHFIFNEITHNLVVEVLNGSPLDALLNILFLRTKNKDTFGKKRPAKSDGKNQQMDTRKNLDLFSFQSQFNKDLLQLLVDKVYTKLLKAVSLQGESYKVRLGLTIFHWLTLYE